MMSRGMVVSLAAGLGYVVTSLAPATADEQMLPDPADRKIEASILIVDSQDAVANWVKDPKGGDSGRMRKVTVGQKLFVPIIVTGLKTTEFGQAGIVADMQFVAPNGKVIFNGRKCCNANRGDPRTPGLVVLNPVLDLTSEDGDPLGTYEVRATVTYGGRTASASEKFLLQAAAADQPEATKESPPAVATAAPPRRPRSHADARTCLDAADNAAVMRCAEKYR
jgi:hypothetical protein